MTTPTQADRRPLPSYARDEEHAAEITAHIRRLVDDAPPLPQRLRDLLRADVTPAAETAA